MSGGRSGLLILIAALAALAVAVYVYVVRSPATLVTSSSVATPRPAPRASPRPSVRTGAAPADPAAMGRLRIVADVPGAAVFFDHNFVGRSPVEVRDVAPGAHRLNVSVQGREMYNETLETGPGPRTVIVRLLPVKLDESLPVVHRHGLGSCEGRLSATLSGLRYETTDKDDAFVRPFAELEPLEVDYGKKNLRVKVRKGKTYNFTTKAPTADDLAAFQQKIEAARQRQ